jgi:hypothetical protein
MAQADLDDGSPTAWRLLFAELLRAAQAVHDAHVARSEAEQASRLAGEARKALEEARGRLGYLEALRAEFPKLVEAARQEVGREEEETSRRQCCQRAQGGLRPERLVAATRRAVPKPSREVAR